MAAKLECEVCGGKLIGKPGGIFECESCGMEYSTEWARQKIQEIRGTVQVEGTVQVTGKVQVEGGTVNVEGAATKESLLKRAKMCCAEKDWNKAKELLEQVLNADPECGEAYLYSAAIAFQCETLEQLRIRYEDVANTRVSGSDQMEKAFRFASGETAALLAQWKAVRDEKVEANLAARRAAIPILEAKRNAIAAVHGRIRHNIDYAFGLRSDGTVLAAGSNNYGNCDVSDWTDIVALVCGSHHTVGLRSDGTVLAVGGNHQGQCDVSDWRDVVSIACGPFSTLGLRRDGTVLAVGNNDKGQCDVGDWRDVAAIYPAGNRTFGLRRDGTVLAAGENDKGQCDVSDWRDVTAIYPAGSNTFGLRRDGTVLVAGKDNEGKCDVVGNWRNVISIVCGSVYTFGLRRDGTVLTAGGSPFPRYQLDVSGWRDVVAITCGMGYIVGLRSDGTALGAGYDYGDLSGWRDIVDIAYAGCLVGLRSDGTIVAAKKDKLALAVSDWKLFNSIETLDQELAEAQERRKQEAEEARRQEEQRKQARLAELEAEKDALQVEYGILFTTLKGLFAGGKRRKEIEARLAEIETEQRGLE